MVGIMPFQLQAAELDTTLPKNNTSTGAFAPSNIDIPSQPLDAALKQLARATGISVAFDSNLATGKTAPAVKGRMKPDQALKMLLAGSGLESTIDKDNAVIKAAAEKSLVDFQQVDTIEVRAKRFYEIGPLGGTGLTKEQIPGNVQSLTAKDIKEARALSLTDLMNSKLQSVNVNDYRGNPFQMDVQYRGFTAGPEIGTPQGLSVFFDGIRVNEPFGDIVNWDMLPLNALAGFDVFPGSNPIFGLGTLGGAISMKTKDGFNNPGIEADVLTGSFDRKQLQLSGGWNNGTVALFGAGNFFLEDGWRENSPSRVNQVFGKASYRGEKLDLSFSTLAVTTDLVGNGLLPSEMYKQDRNGSFTSPDTTENRLFQFQLSGNYFVNDNFTITAQAYRRNSKRNSMGADVYTEHQGGYYRRALNTGEQYTCLFNSTNSYGLPDYYVIDLPNGDYYSSTFKADYDNAFINEFLSNGFDFDAAHAVGVSTALAASGATLNPSLEATPEGAAYAEHAQSVFNAWKNYRQAMNYQSQYDYVAPELPAAPPIPGITNGESGSSGLVYNSLIINPAKFSGGVLDPMSALNANYYYTADGVKHLVLIVEPTNTQNCSTTQANPLNTDSRPLSVEDPNNPGTPLMVDGASSVGGQQPGVVEGTPTAVFTNTDIDQITDGASVQFNWNYPKHKFMVGASIDAPSSKYKSGQMLGMLDAERNAYLAPDEIRDQYAAASQEISNNNFKGNQLTKSLYASETWSPIETLHITGALRYNETHGKNTASSRTYGARVFNISQYEALPDEYGLCVDGVCPTTGYKVPDLSRVLNKPETEKFSYYSLNPSLGVSWQATPELNLYTNWAQGTRTPSVIELGCAFDHTPVVVGGTGGQTIAKSLAENRSCSLPSNLSGDPYLPQIKAQTIDAGMRGRWGNNVEWNLGVYQTELKDDIYMVSFPGNKSFFDTIGDTRRRGIEAGLTAAFGKTSLRLNYALTEATFQDSFMLAADHNSTSVENMVGNFNYGRLIQVNPGDRMPSVPLHNFNATLNYAVTSKWQVGLTAVAHSSSFARGNENNKHRAGEIIYDTVMVPGVGRQQIPRRTTTNSGVIDGYVVFNFKTSYQLTSEWRLGLQVNNIFDKEYFTGGRLGRNPFSPSVYGAIGPDGYNHNSSDWLSTNFLAPGAPRAAWISLSYEFDPRK